MRRRPILLFTWKKYESHLDWNCKIQLVLSVKIRSVASRTRWYPSKFVWGPQFKNERVPETTLENFYWKPFNRHWACAKLRQNPLSWPLNIEGIEGPTLPLGSYSKFLCCQHWKAYWQSVARSKEKLKAQLAGLSQWDFANITIKTIHGH